MKKVIKITIIFIIMLIGFGQFSRVNAVPTRSIETPDSGASVSSTPGWSGKIDDYFNPGKVQTNTDELESKAKIITAIIRNIGIVISVIALMIIGIREMTASAEEKSVIKQSIPGYILGVIMVVAITMLPSIIYEFSSKI